MDLGGKRLVIIGGAAIDGADGIFHFTAPWLLRCHELGTLPL